MEIREHFMSKEQPRVLNKPFGQTVNSELWYLLQLQPEIKGAGLLMAKGVRRDGTTEPDTALCFGNEMTAAIFLEHAALSNDLHIRPILGSDLQEFWLMANV